ncbi:hypothetical protein [Bacillus cihuensis]|uniref:hypothetical protein n=1 Tax=Bacillus cihuensis TaxID=1208599 RepID=UPI00040A22DE|nr:hypothetical protein [Bacillus cihuensis]
MDAAKKALFFGAGLFLTIGLITLFVMVYGSATEASKSAQTEFSGLQAELKDQKYLVYDNTKVSGSQVVNAVRKFKSEGEAGNIGVYIETGKNGNGTGTWYYSNASSVNNLAKASVDTSNLSDETNSNYVNPSGMFNATIVRDSNNAIRAIKFVQEKK